MNCVGGLPLYQAHFDGANYFLGVGGAAAAMNFGGGLARYQAHVEGANYFLGVGRGDAGGGFGIETGQEAMEMGGAVKLRAGAQAVADFCGTFRSVGEAFEQGAE